MSDFQLDTIFSLQQLHIVDTLQRQLQKDLKQYKQSQQTIKNSVQEQKAKIDQQFEKKLRVLHAQRKIKRSAFINKQRLKKTEVMYQMCQEIFQEVLVILYQKSHFNDELKISLKLGFQSGQKNEQNIINRNKEVTKSLFSQKLSQKIQKMNQQKQQFVQFISSEAEYKYTLIKYILEGTIRMFQTKLKIYTLEKDLPILKEIIKDCEICYNSFMQESMGRLGNNFNISYQIVGQKDFLKQRKIDFDYLQNRKHSRIQQELQKILHRQAKSMIHHQSQNNTNNKNSSANKSTKSSAINLFKNQLSHKKTQLQNQKQIKTYSQQQILANKEFLKKNDSHSCIGGIILTDQTGNITYNNTFDTRLEILMEGCLPLVRQALWGRLNNSNIVDQQISNK